MKCLLCRKEGHRAVDCPTRYHTGSGGNNKQLYEEEATEEISEAVAGCVTHWESEGLWHVAISPHLTLGLSLFAQEDLRGYAIIDCGATKSMSGANLFEYVREQIFMAHGQDLTEVNYDDRTRFTYANNTKGTSVGMGGIPHPLGLESKGGKLWFALVATDSPMLLGLDYLKAAQANVAHDGYLEFADGHRERLEPLKSGHWGLPLL